MDEMRNVLSDKLKECLTWDLFWLTAYLPYSRFTGTLSNIYYS